MLSFDNNIRTILLIGLICLPGLGCIKKKSGSNTPANEEVRLTLYGQNPFAGNDQLARAFIAPLQAINPERSNSGLNADNLWAIANCECSPRFNSSYFQMQAVMPGALPQPLAPRVREEIKDNSILKTLLSLPSGLQDISSSLTNLFLRDEKVASTIREGLDDNLKAALRNDVNLSERIRFRFDLFSPPYGDGSNGNGLNPKTFNLRDQGPKWALTFAVPNLWISNGSLEPLAYGNHNLQLLQVAKALSEWTYAFSIDTNKSGSRYGGLSFLPQAGATYQLGGYDPRVDNQVRIISGSYTIDYPVSSALDLATQVSERWTRSSDRIDLSEQAMMWSAAATAYSRLKPSARTPTTASLFHPSTGLFPDETHQVALTFLLGLAEMLDGPFIDQNTRLIRAFAQMKGSNAADETALAPLKSLARLARALNSWIIQTDKITADRLDQANVQKIQSNIAKLKDALRLSIQAMIDNHIANQIRGRRTNGIAMVTSKRNLSRPSMAEVAETLAIMALVDQTVLSSGQAQAANFQLTDWQIKIVSLYHWFAAEYLADLALGTPRENPSAEAVFWTHQALERFALYSPQVSRAPWLNDARRLVTSAVKTWEGSLNP